MSHLIYVFIILLEGREEGGWVGLNNGRNSFIKK